MEPPPDKYKGPAVSPAAVEYGAMYTGFDELPAGNDPVEVWGDPLVVPFTLYLVPLLLAPPVLNA